MTAYHRPDTLDEALRIAADVACILAAGCTDLFPATSAQALTGPVLDLTGIAALKGITRSAAGWRIGAGTSWAEIARADLPEAFAGLQTAAREVGSVQIQTSGTIGGNLCNASPAADGVPPLLTLGASVELAGPAGLRVLALEAFMLGPRRVALVPGEILTAVLIPEVSGQGGFLKLGARAYLVISIVMGASRIVLDDGRIAQAALAMGAASPVARRLTALEAAVTGVRPAEAAGFDPVLVTGALSPLSDPRADETYRNEAAVTLMRRLIGEAGR
ncbi:FAD binding domain-containing protein [Pseudooceanicola sp. 502str34]